MEDVEFPGILKKEQVEIPWGQLSREPLVIESVHRRTSYDV